jgi:O-antigen ligase
MTPPPSDAAGFLPDRWALRAFWLSGAFIILLSSDNILGLSLGQYPKLALYSLPWLMLWPVYSLQVLTLPTYRTEIILIGSILFLGIVNILLSNQSVKSYLIMSRFLATGILATWVCLFLLHDKAQRQAFDLFCCICLGLVAPIEIIGFLARREYASGLMNIFTHNPIPVGTLVLLLFSGPLQLMLSSSRKKQLIAVGLLLLGVALILVTQKRGSLLALMGMLVVGVIYFWRRRWVLWGGLMVLLITLILPFQWLVSSRSLNPANPSDISILCRLESYPFALHIFKQHPFFGTGLRSFTQEKYLLDYQLRNPDLLDLTRFHHDCGQKYLTSFPAFVQKMQTFDNMLVTAFVELGALMTLAYLGLIFYIIVKYCRLTSPFASANPAEFLRLLPLLGFALQSFTYDSLMFPQINWLFHVQLGILAGYSFYCHEKRRKMGGKRL